MPDTTRILAFTNLALHFGETDLDSGYYFAERALELGKKYPRFAGTARAHFAMGYLLSTEGRYSDQVQHLYEARRIYEEAGSVPGTISIYQQLGGLFYNLKMYPQAANYWGQALGLSRKSGRRSDQVTVLNNLGCLHLDQGHLDSAIVLFDEALSFGRSAMTPRLWAIILQNTGEVLTLQGKFNEGRARLQQSLYLLDSLKAIAHFSSVNVSCGKLEMADRQFAPAVRYFQVALRAARQVRALPDEEKALEGLAEVYARLHQPDSSVYYYSLHDKVSDSLEYQRNMTDLGTDLFKREQAIEEEKRLMEAKALQMEIDEKDRRNRELRIFFVAGLVVLLACLAVLFFRYRYNRRMAAELEEKVKERTRSLDETNRELNTFVYQSTHEMRSPLTSILGLTDVALHSPEEREKFLGLIRDRAQHLDRVYSELVHSMNIREREVHRAPVQARALVQEVCEAVNRLREHHPVQVQQHFTGADTITTDRFLLSQVLRVLLLNSIDFSKPGTGAYVKVSLLNEGGRLSLIVEDNGLGVAPEAKEKIFGLFAKGSLNGKGGGLGLYNAAMAVTKLGGKISLESEVGKGTLVKVEL